jgi:hypothetical protein
MTLGERSSQSGSGNIEDVSLIACPGSIVKPEPRASLVRMYTLDEVYGANPVLPSNPVYSRSVQQLEAALLHGWLYKNQYLRLTSRAKNKAKAYQ